MAEKIPVVVDERAHAPLDQADTLPVSAVPISSSSGNMILQREGGLFVGVGVPPELAEQYVDAIAGDDANPGTEEKPLRTVDSALDRMVPGTSGYIVFLRQGQVHQLPNKDMGDITFTIEPYPKMYRDDLLKISTYWNWYLSSEIDRPVLVGTFDKIYRSEKTYIASGLTSSSGGINVMACTIRLTGLRTDLPYQTQGIFGDMDSTAPRAISLFGCIIEDGDAVLLRQRVGPPVTLSMYGCRIDVTPANYHKTFDPALGKIAIQSRTAGDSPIPGHAYIASTPAEFVRNLFTGNLRFFNGVPLNADCEQLYGGPF